MKVYIVTDNPFPNGMASTKRIHNYAKCLTRKGIDCEVVVYRRTEVYGRKPKNTVGVGVADGCKFRYIKGTPLRESNVFARRINDLLDRRRLLRYFRSNLSAGDVVIGYNTSDFFSARIAKYAQSKGAKYVHELCELPFATSAESERHAGLRQRWEKDVMPLCDGFIVISDTLAEYATQHSKPSCKMVKIPILVDLDAYTLTDTSDQASVQYIFHSGTLFQQKDGFIDMLEAFGRALPQLPADTMLIATGAPDESRDGEKIKGIIEKHSLHDRVKFTGFISEDEIRDHLSASSFFIIDKLDTLQNRYCFPTKMGEYMAASKAIVTTTIGEAQKWLHDGVDAILLPPGDIEALSAAIIRLFSDSALRKEIGKNAFETCRASFSLEANAAKLSEFVKSLHDEA